MVVSLTPGQNTLINSNPLPPLPSIPLPSVKVGARLQHFVEAWSNITDNAWALSIISKGYCIPFVQTPPLSRSPIFYPLRDNLHLQLLKAEVQNLLEKEAIERVLDHSSPGFYSRLFLVPKKNGKFKTCNRPFSIEQNDTCRSFSNGNNRLCTQAHRARVLGGVHRFNGRLPTHTHSEGLKEVSPFHSGRRSLPVPFPSVRNFYGPSGVHEFDGNRGSVYQTARSKTDPVFRRLAESQTVKGGIDDRPQYSLEVNYSTRSNPKHGKIGTRSVPGFCVHRYELPHRPGNCEGSRRQSKQHSLSPSPTLCEDGHNGSKVSVPIGYSELNSGPGGSREVAYETSSVSPTFEMEAPCGQPRTGYPFRPTVFISPQLVDESKHLHEGRSVAGAQAGLTYSQTQVMWAGVPT